MKKTVKDIDVKNKRVVLRCDFNVPIEEGRVLDDTKITKSLETINYLLDNNCQIVILSHLGKIKTMDDKKKYSLKPVADVLIKLLKREVFFANTTRSEELTEKVKAMEPKEIILLENTRFEDLNGNLESDCDIQLSEYWASLGEIFVNDAFGTIHRCHASNYGITKFLPSVIGFLIEEELKALDILIDNPEKPFTVIMGGAKLEDKIALIQAIIKRCDYLLLGGGIANTFLKALNFNIGLSICSDKSIPLVKQIMLENRDKILLPLDAIVGNKYNNNYARYSLINGVSDSEVIYDISERTLEKYRKVINESKTIFSNGTMGKYEDKKFHNGSLEMYKMLAKSSARVIIGGGDSLGAIKKFKLEDKYFFLSTGGGATLAYLADPKVKSLERIEDK
ncbi:MAG TPA: phosphoglycerate kinase [Bacilli bacterium]|nr:phosphoglycerate kinase [Bacilli bacterium]